MAAREPGRDVLGIHGRTVFPTRHRAGGGVGVEEAERADCPYLAADRLRVALNERALQVRARVDEYAAGGGHGFDHLPLVLLHVRQAERRRPVDNHAHREVRHLERLEVVGSAVLRAVCDQVVRGEEIDRGRDGEDQPRDAEPPRDAHRPRATRVGDEAVRATGQRPEVRFERLASRSQAW